MNIGCVWSACLKHAPLVLLCAATTSCSASAQTFDPRDPQSPLHLVRTIALPNVRGRIDHLAYDPQSNHLFVAELGNGTVDDIDLTSGMVAGRVSGLHEPQGVAWLPAQQEIAVACGDGSVHFYRRADRQEVTRISLGKDADNVHIDQRNGHLVIGYGSGGLAIVDPSTHRPIGQAALPAHPEAFVLLGSRVFVNVPDARKIVVADLDQAKVIQTLGTGTAFGNYPMASDQVGLRIAVAFRLPGSLSIIDAQSGQTTLSASACGDADDLYFHANRIVIVCGEGTVDLVDESAQHGRVRVATQHGARTGLLDADGNRLFVAVPAGSRPAAVWELSFQLPNHSQ
jgi:hypothetical protein